MSSLDKVIEDGKEWTPERVTAFWVSLLQGLTDAVEKGEVKVLDGELTHGMVEGPPVHLWRTWEHDGTVKMMLHVSGKFPTAGLTDDV